MRRIAAVSILALVATGAAQAGSVDGFDWNGFYSGLVGGAGQLTANVPNEEGVLSGSYYGNVDAAAIGATGGVTAGAQAQIGSFVLGVEGDVSWSDLEASASADAEYYENYAAWDWLTTLRARAGVAVDNALFYVTAGVAAVQARYGSCYMADCAPPDFNFDDDYERTTTQFGIAAGAGTEVVVTDNLTAKAELIYIGLPTYSTPVPYDDFYEANFTASVVMARAGLNWHID